MKIREDTDSLVYNKNSKKFYLNSLVDLWVYSSDDKDFLMKLIKFNDYNQNLLRSKQILIFKCFFLIDFSIRSLKKLYEEPERFKLWDPSVQKTKL